MNWSDLLDSLWTEGEGGRMELVKGIDLWEWFRFIHNDYDYVDRLMIDMETIGGG